MSVTQLEWSRMPTIFLSVNSIWLVTSLSSLLVCSHSNRVLFLTPSFTVQVIVTSIIVVFVLVKFRSQLSRSTGSSWLCQWLVFGQSRHLRTGGSYRLPCNHSWRILSIVGSDTCYRRWFDSHKCSNSATNIHGHQLSLWSCASTSVESMETSHQRWSHYLNKSRIVANRILQHQNSRQRIDYILCQYDWYVALVSVHNRIEFNI